MSDNYDQYIYDNEANWRAMNPQSASESEASYADLNARLAAMSEPDYSLKPSSNHRSGTPRFCEWFRLPEAKRPKLTEPKGRREARRYLGDDVNIVGAISGGVDGLGSRYDQVQAEINGHRVIINRYADGSYAGKVDDHAFRATDGNLDDVIEGHID